MVSAIIAGSSPDYASRYWSVHTRQAGGDRTFAAPARVTASQIRFTVALVSNSLAIFGSFSCAMLVICTGRQFSYRSGNPVPRR